MGKVTVLVLVLGLTIALAASKDRMRFLDLEIPMQYVENINAPAHLDSYEGDDEGGSSIVLRIPIGILSGVEELAALRPADSTLLLILSQTKKHQVRQAERRIWEAMQSRSDRFREAYSERDAETGLFKVFPSHEITFMWHLVTRDPYDRGGDDSGEAGDVVGLCSEKGHGVTCSINFVIDDDLLIEMSSVDRQFLGYLDRLRAGLERTVLSWRRK
jgi:hypothetical protein